MELKFLHKFLKGQTCIFCGSYRPYRLKDKGLKCGKCRKKYSLKKLKRDLEILEYFTLEVSAGKVAKILDLSFSFEFCDQSTYFYVLGRAQNFILCFGLSFDLYAACF